jgi:hypothetical protein
MISHVHKHNSVMSFLIYIFCFILSFNTFVFAQNQGAFLKISGKLINKNNKTVKPFQVNVLESGTEINATQFKNGVMNLDFEMNKNYTLIINAKTYKSTIIIVDTRIPEKKKKEKFRFEFEYTLIPENDTIKKEISELPAAIISYFKDKKGFTISEKYNSFIKDLSENK